MSKPQRGSKAEATPINISEWFRKVREKYAGQMQCGKGCTACCHGLFDISLTDAVDVARGYSRLAPHVQKQVYARAVALYAGIRETDPDLPVPTLLSEDDILVDEIVEAAQSPPCPFLGEAGECGIYENRPLPCRLEGVPMVDVRGGLFGGWCELNFRDGVPKDAKADLQIDYDLIDARQGARSETIALRAGLHDARAVTFIPAVVAEYDRFWKRLLRDDSRR